MINLFTSLTFNDGLNKLIELMKKTDVNNLENNHIILVPDKYSLNIEKQVLENLDGKGALNIEVLTFSRLILRLKEIDIKKYIQLSDAVMIIKKLCLENCDKFKTFSKSANLKTFAENMLLIINQFKSSSISCQMLKDSLKNLNKSFSKKLFDIVLLYEKYTGFLGDDYFDSSDMLRELPVILKQSEFIKSCNVYVIGFDSLTSQGENCIYALAKFSKSLNLFAVKTDRPDLEKINYVYEKYLKLGNDFNLKEIKLQSAKSEIFDTLKQNLFSRKNTKTAENNNVELFEGSGIFDEAQKCAVDINYSVLGQGLRYSDIAVVFTDENMGRTLQNVFVSHDIPFYIESKKTLDNHPFPKLILDIINIQRLNFDRENFLALLKNPFLETEYSLQDKFENYVLKYAIERQKFLAPLENFIEDNVEYLKLEKTRQNVLNVINLLPMPKKATGTEYCKNLRGLIEKFDAEKKLRHFNENLKSGNYLFYLGYSEQILLNINEILSSIEYIFKDTVFSLEEFYKVLSGGFSSKELALIPKVTDCVNCGGYKSVVFSNFKKLYVLGCVKNSYPAITENTGIIKDEDIDILVNIGLNLEPKTEDINERERYFIYSMFLNSPKSLSLSYSGANPAECFTDIKNSFTKNGKELTVKTSASLSNNTEEKIKELYNENQLIKYFCEKLLKIKNGAPDDGIIFNILKFVKDNKLKNTLEQIYLKLADNIKNDETIESGIFFKNNKTSVSALESYFACPYKHFLRYGLYAKEREIGDFKPVNIGRFLHLAAEKFVDGKDFNCDINLKAQEIFEEIITLGEYKKYLSDPYCKNVLYKLKDELVRVLNAIAMQFNQSDFKPLYTEAQFGKKEKLPPIILNYLDKEIFIEGVIDRIDVLNLNGENYIRIIDYKSGVTSYSEKDLYYGIKIQLFIYLYALIKNKKYKPAGIYYFPIHNKFTEADRSDGVYCMAGPTLNNLEVIYASDKKLKTENTSKIINVKIDDKLCIGRYSKVLSLEDFADLCNYAKHLCDNCIKEIKDGNIDIFPQQTACVSCGYINICKNYLQQNMRKTMSIKISQIKEAALCKKV